MYFGKNAPCFKCEHYCMNNFDGLTSGCRAFPNGIPESVKIGYNHNEIIKGQKGDFIFTEIKEESFNPFAGYVNFLNGKK